MPYIWNKPLNCWRSEETGISQRCRVALSLRLPFHLKRFRLPSFVATTSSSRTERKLGGKKWHWWSVGWQSWQQKLSFERTKILWAYFFYFNIITFTIRRHKLIFQKLAFGLQWMLQTVILQNQYLQTKVFFFLSLSPTTISPNNCLFFCTLCHCERQKHLCNKNENCKHIIYTRHKMPTKTQYSVMNIVYPWIWCLHVAHLQSSIA